MQRLGDLLDQRNDSLNGENEEVREDVLFSFHYAYYYQLL